MSIDLNPYNLKEKQAMINQYKGLLKELGQETDEIIISDSECKKLRRLWDKTTKQVDYIPTDIIFSRTIPIRNMKIKIKDCKMKESIDGNGDYVFQVSIIEDLDHIAKYIQEEDYASEYALCIGLCVFYYADNKTLVFPICVMKGSNNIELSRPAMIKNGQFYFLDEAAIGMEDGEIISFFNMLMGQWYSIELALLHPVIKEIFANPKSKRVFDKDAKNNNKNKKKKSITRNVKYRVINNGTYDDLINKRGYTRHTLAWHVKGFWRTNHTTGKQTYVDGFWKGELRHLKQNTNGAKKRVIAAKDTTLKEEK